MKKIVFTFLAFFAIFISKQSLSIEKGKWSFVKDEDWCYIGSSPIKSDLPETKKRGQNYILVYKITGSDENVIQIEAGYKYNLNKKINVKIDNTEFNRNIDNSKGKEEYQIEIKSDFAKWFKNDNTLVFTSKDKQVETTINFLLTE